MIFILLTLCFAVQENPALDKEYHALELAIAEKGHSEELLDLGAIIKLKKRLGKFRRAAATTRNGISKTAQLHYKFSRLPLVPIEKLDSLRHVYQINQSIYAGVTGKLDGNFEAEQVIDEMLEIYHRAPESLKKRCASYVSNVLSQHMSMVKRTDTNQFGKLASILYGKPEFWEALPSRSRVVMLIQMAGVKMHAKEFPKATRLYKKAVELLGPESADRRSLYVRAKLGELNANRFAAPEKHDSKMFIKSIEQLLENALDENMNGRIELFGNIAQLYLTQEKFDKFVELLGKQLVCLEQDIKELKGQHDFRNLLESYWRTGAVLLTFEKDKSFTFKDKVELAKRMNEAVVLPECFWDIVPKQIRIAVKSKTPTPAIKKSNEDK